MSGRDFQPLESFLSRGVPLEIEEAIPLIEKITRAVSEIHQTGEVHRDLGRYSILLNSKREVHIAPTRVLEPPNILASESSGLPGTIDYVCPEYLNIAALTRVRMFTHSASLPTKSLQAKVLSQEIL